MTTKHTPPERGYVPEGPFDPEAWLEVADAQGMDCYLWVSWNNDRKEPVDAWGTHYLEPPYDEPIDLMGWLRPTVDEGEKNEHTLCDYMESIGRFGRREDWQQYEDIEQRRNVMEIWRAVLREKLIEANTKLRQASK